MRYITGYKKVCLYLLIAIDVALRYIWRVAPWRYPLFLCRAARLLLAFRHNKVVATSRGYKLQLYLPAWPSRAFFAALENKLLRQPPSATTVVYSISKACDYKCPHCYQRNDRGADMSDELMIETALKIKQAGTTMFDIEGGEPLLRLPRLLALVKALGNNIECWVNTHGGRADLKTLAELKAAGVYGLMISVHSPHADEHDAFTGMPGSFEKACAAVRTARSLGLTVAFNSVLTSQQLQAGRLDELMELAKSLDCDFVQLIHPKAAGKWLGADEQIRHDAGLIEMVQQRHLLYNSRLKTNYPALAAQLFEERPQGVGCTAGGVDRFYVNATGEVQPCEFLNVSFGNVHNESYADIFARMRSYFPQPCCNWLCCSQAGSIEQAIGQNGGDTPLRCENTCKLVAGWERGSQTEIYRKLGIYK